MRHAGFGVSQSSTPPGRRLQVGELHQRDQRLGRHVLDHLGREDPAERAVGLPSEVGEGVAVLGRTAGLAAARHHRGVEIDATRLDSGLPAQLEKLAAAAAHVEHGPRRGEEIEIRALSVADLLAGPAVAVLELDVG